MCLLKWIQINSGIGLGVAQVVEHLPNMPVPCDSISISENWEGGEREKEEREREYVGMVAHI